MEIPEIMLAFLREDASRLDMFPNRYRTILYGRRLMETGAAVLWTNLPTNINVHRHTSI